MTYDNDHMHVQYISYVIIIEYLTLALVKDLVIPMTCLL